MLSRAQEKLIKSLQQAKGRETSGLCLVEGPKVIETAGSAVEYSFTPDDSDVFEKLVTTQTPQEVAGVAKIPAWNIDDITAYRTIIVLDGVQDPGNVGTILRLCLGFDASLLLIASADVTSPKVVRASVGAMFLVPWMKLSREEASDLLRDIGFPIYRLEKTQNSVPLTDFVQQKNAILIAGSEGTGIHLPLEAPAIQIAHHEALESLNVAQALSIAMHARYIGL